MDEDDFDRNSDRDRGYRNNNNERSRRQLEKRPARRVEDDFDDDELFAEMRTDARDKEQRRTQAQGQSKKPHKGTSGSGAETRRARVEEEDEVDEDEEERGPTFRLVCPNIEREGFCYRISFLRLCQTTGESKVLIRRYFRSTLLRLLIGNVAWRL